jgi:ABC-type phosphate transport system auxiliary subunit
MFFYILAQGLTQYLIKTGNRDISGMDFRWLLGKDIKKKDYPANIMVLERRNRARLLATFFHIFKCGDLCRPEMP